MRLKALDQIHISAVKPDSLRPGEEFDISDEAGRDLLQRHPVVLREVAAPAAKAAAQPQNKAEPAPANKAEDPPANKAAKPSRKRGK